MLDQDESAPKRPVKSTINVELKDLFKKRQEVVVSGKYRYLIKLTFYVSKDGGMAAIYSLHDLPDFSYVFLRIPFNTLVICSVCLPWRCYFFDKAVNLVLEWVI